MAHRRFSRVSPRGLRRIDGAIAAGLVVLLLALLVLGLTTGADPGHPASAPASRDARPVGSLLAAPPVSSSTTPDPPTTTSLAPSSTTSTTSTSTTAATSPTGSPLPPPIAGPVSAVGDSIMLDIASDLETDVPGVQVDGVVGRQFETGIGVVAADRAAGTLGKVLVVELGTNGTVTVQDVDAMMQAAQGVSRVVFVNVDVPRSWETPDNAALAAGVAQYPGLAYLADWYTLSASHPEWFAADQVHLDPAGAQAMAQLIAEYT